MKKRLNLTSRPLSLLLALLMLLSVFGGAHARLLFEGAAKMVRTCKAAPFRNGKDLVRALPEQLLCLFRAHVEDKLLRRCAVLPQKELAQIPFADAASGSEGGIGEGGISVALVHKMHGGGDYAVLPVAGEAMEHSVEEGKDSCAVARDAEKCLHFFVVAQKGVLIGQGDYNMMGRKGLLHGEIDDGKQPLFVAQERIGFSLRQKNGNARL